ncbi:MAG: MCE family protein [Persephonella sp.]|nr:MAG: MCE family protein [Persephonella sp.]RUM60527.1 MAG: MCE family protein [Persephonella sp.]
MNTQVKVGAFILFMLIIAGYLVITFGRGNFGGDLALYYVYFDDAGGLSKGADIQVKGVKAGKVEDITIDKDGKVKVKLLIDKRIPIYKNAKVYIRTLGLMGDKYVYIDPGTPDAGKLSEGQPLGKGERFAGVEETFNNINRAVEEGDLKDLIISLRLLVKHIDQLVQENRENIKTTTENFKAISQELREYIPRLADRIDRVAYNLERITGENRQDIRELVVNLREFSRALRDKTPAVMDSVKDTADEIRETVAENRPALRNALKSAESILAKIDRGEGTLGKLVNEDTLYNDIREGVNAFSEPFKVVKKSNLDIKLYAEKHTGNKDSKAGIAGIFAPKSDRYIYIGVLSNSNGRVYKDEEIYSNGRTTVLTKRDYGILFDLQYARKILDLDSKSSIWIRGGLKDSGGDVGLDYTYGDNIVIKTDLYNFGRDSGFNQPDKPELDIVLNYKLPDYPIFIGVGGSDLLNDRYRGVYIGGGFLFRDNELKYILGSMPKP